jgi:hypothetical protein
VSNETESIRVHLFGVVHEPKVRKLNDDNRKRGRDARISVEPKGTFFVHSRELDTEMGKDKEYCHGEGEKRQQYRGNFLFYDDSYHGKE